MTGIPVAVGELVDTPTINEWARGRYRKTTAKAVNTTVAATDLLNGEITIDAGALSTDRVLTAILRGDFLQNTGADQAPPRFQVLFGGTTILDTGASGLWGTNAARAAFLIEIQCMNLGAANSQWWTIDGWIRGGQGTNTTNSNNNFTTGLGRYGSTSNPSGSVGVAFSGGNTSAIDTTVAGALAVNVINGVSNASYETRLLSFLGIKI